MKKSVGEYVKSKSDEGLEILEKVITGITNSMNNATMLFDLNILNPKSPLDASGETNNNQKVVFEIKVRDDCYDSKDTWLIHDNKLTAFSNALSNDYRCYFVNIFHENETDDVYFYEITKDNMKDIKARPFKKKVFNPAKGCYEDSNSYEIPKELFKKRSVEAKA